MADWSFAEDRRPGMQFLRTQPERTMRGEIWTWLVTFDWPSRGYTQMTVRDCSGEIIVDHGRIYAIPHEGES